MKAIKKLLMFVGLGILAACIYVYGLFSEDEQEEKKIKEKNEFTGRKYDWLDEPTSEYKEWLRQNNVFGEFQFWCEENLRIIISLIITITIAVGIYSYSKSIDSRCSIKENQKTQECIDYNKNN